MVKIEVFDEKKQYKLADGFFEMWGNHPDKETHLKILKQSYKSIVAVKDDEIIGFVNAISDGVLSAYIPLLEVIPCERNKKIATKLLEKLFDEIKDLYMIDLSCDEHLVPFYEKFHMFKSRAMIRRNYDNKSGKR